MVLFMMSRGDILSLVLVPHLGKEFIAAHAAHFFQGALVGLGQTGNVKVFGFQGYSPGLALLLKQLKVILRLRP